MAQPTDIPHIRVDISASPLIPRCYRVSSCLGYHLLAEMLPESGETPTTTTLYSQRQTANSSSSLSSNCPPSSSSSSTSSIPSYPSSDRVQSAILSYPERIPATSIMALLNLLDAFDADVDNQVAHFKENIKETRSLIQLCRSERVERLARARQKKAAIDRGTLAADSEFWCSI